MKKSCVVLAFVALCACLSGCVAAAVGGAGAASGYYFKKHYTVDVKKTQAHNTHSATQQAPQAV